MPIIGTTTNTPIQTNRIGKAWKGKKATGSGKQKRPGQDLGDRFRLDLPEPFASVARASYGTLEPETIRVFFPYDSVDEVFETWNDAFTAKGFAHRCNGERIVREVTYKKAYRQGKEYKKRCASDCDKPCQRKPDEVICSACQSTGYLSFIVRELFGIGGMSQVVCQTVSGIYDVVGIHRQLSEFQQKYGSLRQSPIPSPSTYGFIPFVLRRVKQEISRPMMGTDGGYTRTTYNAVVITEDPQWLNHWAQIARKQMILQAVENGQIGLLMPEDRQLLQEMQSISLPSAASVNQPSLPQQPEQLALTQAPTIDRIDTEEVAQEWADEDEDLGESVEEYRDNLLNREPKERIAAVNAVLKLDIDDVYECCNAAKSNNEDDATTRELTDESIIQMLLKFGHSRKMSMPNSFTLIEKIQTELPHAVDEDLAQIFVAESMKRQECALGNGTPETVNGVSIE